MPLPRTFYNRPALVVAKELLGKVLVLADDTRRRAGIIVETEAYVGQHDLAAHSSKGRTARTDVMFGPPGHAYVYLIYGMYECMNVVTEPDGVAAAVLIRGIEPVEGIGPDIRTDGPGKLTRALGITRAHNRADLVSSALFIEEGGGVAPRKIARGPRIGVHYAGVWAAKPYRFWVKDNPHVSRAKR